LTFRFSFTDYNGYFLNRQSRLTMIPEGLIFLSSHFVPPIQKVKINSVVSVGSSNKIASELRISLPLRLSSIKVKVTLRSNNDEGENRIR
jgi:hypothetical protein